jgi:hypothetical protein
MIQKLIEFILSNWGQYFPGAGKPEKITPLMAKAFRNVIFFLFKDNDKAPFAQLKIGTDETYIGYCKKETEALKQIGNNKYGTLASSCSKLFYSDMFDGYYVHIREFLPGRSIQDTLFFGDKYGVGKLQPLVDWIADIYLETRHTIENYDYSTAAYDKYLGSYVKRFTETHALSQAEKHFLDGFVRQAKAGQGVNFNIGFEHGDMNPGNVLLGKDGFFLIDWAQAYFEGFPLGDLINFFVWYGMIVCPQDVHGGSLTKSIGDKTKATWITRGLVKQIFFSDNTYSRAFKNYILNYMNAVNMDARLIKFLFTAFSIRQPVFELFQLLCEEEENFIFKDR